MTEDPQTYNATSEQDDTPVSDERSLEVPNSRNPQKDPTLAPSSWSVFASLLPQTMRSVTVENKDSVARDHMANERTFLAWLKASMSFISLGIGIAQLFRLEEKDARIEINLKLVSLMAIDSSIKAYGKALGSAFIVLGILTLLMGAMRFYTVQATLLQNYYPIGRISILTLLLLLLLIVVLSFIVILRSM